MMRLVFVLATAGVLFFVVHSWEGSFSPASSIRELSKRLDKATNPHPKGRWVDQLNGICGQREQQLAKLGRPSVLDGQALAAYSARVLAIHRAYAKRVARVRAPKPYAADLRQIRAFNSEQLEILQRVTLAARNSGVGSAAKDALALRDLAGRSNPVFVRLGLNGCAMRPSGMPL
jgi:hypothetical protein